ncbi:glycosyltransferase [Fontibacter flavus]|uniref:Glycosyltransferase n=1 Tax=Fontibacter flavus TaxID=654838 RepID=A0ABV6FVK9_9BACT
MKILHTISGLDVYSGGPSLSTWTLLNGLRDSGVEAEILTYASKKGKDQMIGNADFVHALAVSRIPRLNYSPALKTFLKSSNYALYHGHGLWEYPSHAIASHARKTKKPYLISPRGMLYPEALQISSLFKKVAMPLYQRRDLEMATVLHATCQQEMLYIREMGFQNPIAVIPNPIEINIPKSLAQAEKTKKQVGFIGRFAPIKNLEMLLQAWAETGAKQPDWELVLIGDGDAVYRNELTQLAKNLGIQNIRFTGFLRGEEKEKALQALDYLALPSKSENFGMVVPEALLREIPVIASKGTPWEDLLSHQAGWWVDNNLPSLVKALKSAMELSEEGRQVMGANGRKLVEEKYSMESVAEQMVALYCWILKEGEKPDFVYV